MYAFKTISFAFLLLASNVQAGRISYTCYNKSGGVDKKGALEQKAGGTIPDDQEKVVVNGMHQWSNGKYTASISRVTKIVVVKCVDRVANKDLATKANNEQEQLVNSHIKKTKRDNDDDEVEDDENDDENDDDADDVDDDALPEFKL